MKSFAELDPKLVSIKKQCWQGKDLPFPILLDATGATEKLYGIRAHPTGLLIDPEGKLVGESSAADLESKLPPLPAAQRWARHRDMRKNVYWSFETKDNTPAKFAKSLSQWARCDVEVDADAVRAAGLTPDGPLPGMVIGYPITLRSLEALLLRPHGLGLAPASDGVKLRLTKRPPTDEDESYIQKARAKELLALLDGKTAPDGNDKAKPLDIKDQPLLDAVKQIAREFDLPLALDAAALRAKTLDPAAKVSGRVDGNHLGQSLTAMVEPLGLTVVVRHEVVLIAPRGK